MCVILFALGCHPRFRLIVAANRDEAYARPALPAAFWVDQPHVFGGRDLEHGGTWLGVATTGRFAAITNYRQGRSLDGAAQSRGDLTREYLTGTHEPLEYMRRAEEDRAQYRGYSFIAGSADALYFYSNRGNAVQTISPGVHGLSNRLLDEPWPKVQKGVATMTGLLHSSESEISESLFELLRDRTPAPDDLLPSTGIELERERALSAAFIAGDTYGTRASTVVLVDRDGRVLFAEHTFGPGGVATGATEQRFSLDSPNVLNAPQRRPTA